MDDEAGPAVMCGPRPDRKDFPIRQRSTLSSMLGNRITIIPKSPQ